MIELKYETMEELGRAYTEKFNEFGKNFKPNADEKFKVMIAESLILEYKFYRNQIEAKYKLNEKFEKTNLRLFEQSEGIKVKYEARKAKYRNKRQKALNKKLFKTFKKECKLGIRKTISDENLIFEEAEKRFNEEQELMKKARQNANHLKSIEKQSDTKLLKQRSEGNAGKKDNKAT